MDNYINAQLNEMLLQLSSLKGQTKLYFCSKGKVDMFRGCAIFIETYTKNNGTFKTFYLS